MNGYIGIWCGGGGQEQASVSSAEVGAEKYIVVVAAAGKSIRVQQLLWAGEEEGAGAARACPALALRWARAVVA